MRLTVYFDGASYPNPGVMGIGVVIEGPDGNVLKEVSERLPGQGTSNVAEYNAIIRGLSEAKALGATSLVVRGDSQLVVQQLRGRYRVKEPHLKPLYQKVLELANAIRDVSVEWIPREQNKRADALSYKAVAPAAEPQRPKVGSKPTPREHSILCPTCGKPCNLKLQRFQDGREHIRKECPQHGFIGYAPDVEPFRTLARKGSAP